MRNKQQFDPYTAPIGTVVLLAVFTTEQIEDALNKLRRRGLGLFYHGPGDRYVVRKQEG